MPEVMMEDDHEQMRLCLVVKASLIHSNMRLDSAADVTLLQSPSNIEVCVLALRVHVVLCLLGQT
jgi:hypothetical protein